MPIRLTLNSGFPSHAAELLSLAQSDAAAVHPLDATRPVSGAAFELADGSRFHAPSAIDSAEAFRCAEAAALDLPGVGPHPQVRALAIVGGVAGRPHGEAFAPCGACRQLLWDRSDPRRDVEIYCGNLELTRIVLVTLTELLPLAWRPPSG